MAGLADIRLPSSYTLDELNAAWRAQMQALQDDGQELSGPQKRRLSGQVGLPEDFDFNAWQDAQFNDALRNAGYVEVGQNTGGRTGLESAIARSAAAQQRGIKSVDDFYRLEHGAGMFETDPRTGKEYYKGTSVDQLQPFDMGLSEDHWTGKLTLGLITAAMAAAGGAAMTGTEIGAAGTAGAGTTAGSSTTGQNMGFWDQISNFFSPTSVTDGVNPMGLDGIAGDALTPAQSWAQSLGGLAPDGTINWAAIDASPIIQEMGAISATADGAIPFGTSAFGSGTILDQVKTLMNGGNLPSGSTLSGLKSVFSGNNGGNQGGNMGNIIGALGEYFAQQNAADKYAENAREAARLSDPFRDQRGFYQDQLKQSYTDPNYFANNPVFKGMRDTAINDTTRSLAAQGYNMSGNMASELSQRLQQTGMNFALPFQQATGQFAGAGISPGYAGFLQQQGMNQATQAGMSSLGALGVAGQQIFGNGAGTMPKPPVFNSQSNNTQTGNTQSGQSSLASNIMNLFLA